MPLPLWGRSGSRSQKAAFSPLRAVARALPEGEGVVVMVGVMPELAEVARAFEGTALAGRKVRAVPVADTGETGFELDIEGVPPLRAWELARPICAGLGLWPFASDNEHEGVYSRYFFDEVRDGRDQSPRAILARADAMPWPIQDCAEYFAREWVEVVRMCRHETVQGLGDVPSEKELLAGFPEPEGPFRDAYEAVERMLLEWEEARRSTSAQEPPEIFNPNPDLFGPWLIMAPTSLPWAVPAYQHFCGAGSDRTEALIRTLRSWHERHGATICAATNVTLHLHVSRPIEDIHEALTVAAEHMPFNKWDHSLRAHARALFRANFWEVYDRP